MLKVLETKTTKVGRFTIVTDQVERNGHKGVYDYVTIRKGISVLPILPDGSILLQREYRHPIGKWQYELPSGIIDEGETPDQAAVRELHEETGYTVRKLIPLGSFYPSFGATDEEIFLFAAYLDRAEESEREPLEEIEDEIVSEERFIQMVAEGEISHGGALAAWARWTSRRADDH